MSADKKELQGRNLADEVLNSFGMGLMRAAQDGKTVSPNLEAALREQGADDAFIETLQHTVSPVDQHNMIRELLGKPPLDRAGNVASLTGDDPLAGLPVNHFKKTDGGDSGPQGGTGL